jgi:hypothetical protein
MREAEKRTSGERIDNRFEKNILQASSSRRNNADSEDCNEERDLAAPAPATVLNPDRLTTSRDTTPASLAEGRLDINSEIYAR